MKDETCSCFSTDSVSHLCCDKKKSQSERDGVSGVRSNKESRAPWRARIRGADMWEASHGRLFCFQGRPGADQRGLSRHVFTLRCSVSIWDYLHVGFVVERSKRGRDASEMILWHILANLRGEDFIMARKRCSTAEHYINSNIPRE